MTEQEIFGERLRRRRMMLGWNQQHLAERLGWQAATISRYERGRYHSTMSFARLRHLADVLQTTTDYLLGRSEDPGPIPPRPCPAEGPCLDGLAPLPVTTSLERTTADAEYTNFSPPST